MKPPFKFPRTTTSEAFRTHLNRFPFEHNYLKKYLLPLALSSLVVLGAVTAQAQSTYLPYYFTTFAGNAPGGDGTGSQAGFYQPYGVAADSAGNVYVADTNNHTIRKITPAGVVTTLAGLAANSGSTDGTGADARFTYPFGVAVDSAGSVYVADTNNSTIRKITSAGVVTTLAGMAEVEGSADGTGSAAQFDYPYGIAVDIAGNVYVADTQNDTIRQITPAGVVTTLAGAVGVTGSADGTGSAALFNAPSGIAVDSAGNLYVADTYNFTIRKITSAGVVTTLAGTAGSAGRADGAGSAAQFYYPYGVAVDSAGNVYVADADNNTIRKITSTGLVTTLAGTAGTFGSANGTGSAARFTYPYGVAADGAGNLYVADSNNQEIRKITSAGVVTTLAGSTNYRASPGSVNGVGRAARFAQPSGVAASKTGIYVADTDNNTIRKITSTGAVTTLAGTAGVPGSANGTGSAARFNHPSGVAVDNAENVYVADTDNNTIRKITSTGVVTTLAGTAGVPGSADGMGSAAQFSNPFGVAVDSTGGVYVADTNNSTIRKITSAGVVTTLAGTAGTVGSADGTGSAAQFSNPFGIAVDSTGNVYVADTNNGTIRKITSAGVVTTLAGTAGVQGSADGTGSAAQFNYPRSVAVDSAKNVYVADTQNDTIREITPAGVVTTLAGVPGSVGIADGTGSAARFRHPNGVAVASTGKVYVADTTSNTIRSGVLADLKITVTDGKTSVIAGSKDTYSIVVTNTGLSGVTGSLVSDTFPTTFSGVTFTATQLGGASGFTASGSGNISDSVTMPPASTITYKATGTLSPSATGTLSNTATVSVPSGVNDPILSNNTATDKDRITYTITAANFGPSNVRGAVIGDSVPSTLTGVTFTATQTGGASGFSASGTGNVNDTVAMAVGSVITYTATCTVSASATGTISDTATVTALSGVTDPNLASNTDTIY